MTDTHVLSALRAKRAEVSGYINDLRKNLKIQRAKLEHIDATIRVFAPSAVPERIPPKRTYRKAEHFLIGEIPRRCLDILRDATEPLSAVGIVEAILSAKALAMDDAALKADCMKRVVSVLRTFKSRGKVVKTGGGEDARWSLPSSYDAASSQ
jgi:hypothetical protein